MDKKFDLNIPQEKFQFANDVKIMDQKFDTKPIGYFKDALIRFKKNKASVVAFFIILLIVLFAVVTPLVITGKSVTESDSYYAMYGPRHSSLKKIGLLTGTVNRELSEKGLYLEYSKAVAAEGADGTIKTVGEVMDSYYQPIYKVKGSKMVSQGKNEAKVYKVSIDQYLSVGFIYKTITEEEYNAIRAFEEEYGVNVLYPLIDKYSAKGRSYSLDSENANYWYKMKTTGSEKGAPIKVTAGSTISLELNDELVFEDNYYRVGGEIQYKKYNGSENYTTYEVRMLYYNYYRFTHDGAQPDYIMGTDSQGYDLAVRLARGVRLSLVLAVIVSIVNFIIGAIYGSIEGYYGGTIDIVLERVSDILSGVPFIIVATLFQMHLAKDLGAVPSLIFAFVLTGWIGTASRVRTQFYRFKNQEYVMAARTLGARDRRIIWKHIFPNTLGTIITSSALVIPSVIFSESSLSFLGIVNLGSKSSTSLGTLLAESTEIWTTYPHLMLFPAIIISLLMISFNLFGNGLRDAFNPSLRGNEE